MNDMLLTKTKCNNNQQYEEEELREVKRRNNQENGIMVIHEREKEEHPCIRPTANPRGTKRKSQRPLPSSWCHMKRTEGVQYDRKTDCTMVNNFLCIL